MCHVYFIFLHLFCDLSSKNNPEKQKHLQNWRQKSFCASPNEAFFHRVHYWISAHFLRRIGDLFFFYLKQSGMNSQLIFLHTWVCATTKMIDYAWKPAYQCIIKCNACTSSKICMTNWLGEPRTRTSSEPQQWSSLKFLSLGLRNRRETKSKSDWR